MTAVFQVEGLALQDRVGLRVDGEALELLRRLSPTEAMFPPPHHVNPRFPCVSSAHNLPTRLSPIYRATTLPHHTRPFLTTLAQHSVRHTDSHGFSSGLQSRPPKARSGLPVSGACLSLMIKEIINELALTVLFSLHSFLGQFNACPMDR